MIFSTYKGICDIFYNGEQLPPNEDGTIPPPTYPQLMLGAVDTFIITEEQLLPLAHISIFYGAEGIDDIYDLAFKDYKVSSKNRQFMFQLLKTVKLGMKDYTKIADIDFFEENPELFV